MRKTSFLLSFIVLFCVERAGAQPSAAIPECLAHPACKLLNDQARQQSGAGLLADALHSYKRAYEIMPDPRLLYSIARVLHKQGQTADAIPYYRQFLAIPFTQPADQAQQVPAQAFLTQCEATQKPQIDLTKPPNPTTPDTPPPPVAAKRPPVYKRWWFWTIVGGAVAAVAVGVGVGIGTAAREPDLTDVMQYRPFNP